jgi:hypothetical protein
MVSLPNRITESVLAMFSGLFVPAPLISDRVFPPGSEPPKDLIITLRNRCSDITGIRQIQNMFLTGKDFSVTDFHTSAQAL